MKKIQAIAFVFAILSSTALCAQTLDTARKNYIGIIAKYNGKNAVLRWAPSNSASFFLLKKYGYRIEKAQIGKDSTYFKAVWKEVGTFKPADSAVWAKRIDKTNNYQVVAAHCAIAGINAPLPQNPNFGELMKRKNEEQNIHGFAMMAADFDTTAANLLGLRWEDKDVLKNAVYAYRIVSLVPENILKINGAETYVQTLAEEAVNPPSLEEFGFENRIMINWYNTLHKNYFTGYFLERGDKNGRNFKRINKTPMVLLSDPNSLREKDLYTYIDTVPKDYEVHSYRLVGITPFGEYSEPGPVIYSYGRDRTGPNPAYDVQAIDVFGKYLDIRWKKDKYEADFTGFNVLKASNPNGPFVIINDKLLPKGTTSFTDKFPTELQGSYYKIEALDTAQNQGWSLGVYGFLRDSIPPSKPIGLSGKADKNGVVTLKWNLGPEVDLKGYKVYYANQIDHEFTILNGELWQDTVFVDSVNINTLTEQIYYQIAAADGHYNHSNRSEIIKVTLPDTVPPVKPMFQNILVTDTAVYLSWIPSSSLDVLKHKIYRKKGNEQFTVWKTFDGKGQTNITDADVKVGEVYTYKIEALDENDLSSGFPLEVSAKIYDVGKRKPIENFAVVYNKDRKRNILTWTYPASDKYHFVVYRSYNESTFRVYRSVDGNKNSFEDYDLLGKGTYTYAVVAYHKDGGTSGLTKKIIVNVR